MNNDGSQKSFSDQQLTNRTSGKKSEHYRKSSDINTKIFDYNKPFVFNEGMIIFNILKNNKRL